MKVCLHSSRADLTSISRIFFLHESESHYSLRKKKMPVFSFPRFPNNEAEIFIEDLNPFNGSTAQNTKLL